MSSISLQPFDFRGQCVRALVDENDDPWLIAMDVCKVLGLGNVTEALRSLDDDEKSNISNSEVAQNGGRSPLIISEGGFWKLVMRSRKPEAKDFQRWVTHVVLKQIRKHGAYMSDEVIEQTLTDPDYLIRLATTLKEEKQARALAESQVRQLVPKAQALDDFTGTKGAYGVSEAAKILANSGVKIGPRGLFELLCEMGWIYRKESHWMAKADRVASGHLMMHDYRSEGQRRDGSRLPFFPQVRVTRKGMELLHRRLTEHQIDRQLNDLGRVA